MLANAEFKARNAAVDGRLKQKLWREAGSGTSRNIIPSGHGFTSSNPVGTRSKARLRLEFFALARPSLDYDPPAAAPSASISIGATRTV